MALTRMQELERAKQMLIGRLKPSLRKKREPGIYARKATLKEKWREALELGAEVQKKMPISPFAFVLPMKIVQAGPTVIKYFANPAERKAAYNWVVKVSKNLRIIERTEKLNKQMLRKVLKGGKNVFGSAGSWPEPRPWQISVFRKGSEATQRIKDLVREADKLGWVKAPAKFPPVSTLVKETVKPFILELIKKKPVH